MIVRNYYWREKKQYLPTLAAVYTRITIQNSKQKNVIGFTGIEGGATIALRVIVIIAASNAR